jgi:hypothetical protein
MTALRTTSMLAASLASLVGLALAWPLIRGSVEQARRNIGRSG